MSRILIVDDSPAMRTYVRATLESTPGLGDDLEIVEAASGFDALRLLPRNTYDLVITDINMPDINGLELVRFVRQSAHLRRVGLLIISTLQSDRDITRVMALGADAFLPKPFKPPALRDAVTRILDGRGSQVPGAPGLPGAPGGGAP